MKLISSAASRGDPVSAQKTARTGGIHITASNSVEVVVVEKWAGAVSARSIKNMGGEILGRTGNLKKIELPAGQLGTLADDQEGISYIRSPHFPTKSDTEPAGSSSPYDSTGPNLTGASQYHIRNYLGQEVKVAVIDLIKSLFLNWAIRLGLIFVISIAPLIYSEFRNEKRFLQ